MSADARGAAAPLPDRKMKSVPKEIIAGVVLHRARLAILRRSPLVTGENGYWNVITGYVEPGVPPLQQAYLEIEEETGIGHEHLRLKKTAVQLLNDYSGQVWKVHVFQFDSATDRIVLNWENDSAHWVAFDKLFDFETVPWIRPVLECCQLPGDCLPAAPAIAAASSG